MMKRIFALLLCAATLLTSLAFVGCSEEDKEKEEDKGQYITTYLTDNVYDLDPAHAYLNESTANVVSLMFDTLFKLDKNGKVQKSLVKKYKIEENEAAGEYIMQIYLKDTYWSDGTAVSANDIVFAWKRLLEVDADYEAASLLFDIKNARRAKEGDCSIDDVRIYPAEKQMLEIYFEGKIDYDQFMLNLCSLALAPLRDDVVSKSDDWAKKPGTMVCSGPFKLGRVNVKITGEKVYDEYHEWTDNGFDKVGQEAGVQVITDFMLERNMYYYRNYEEDRLKKSVTPYKICVDCSLTDEQLTEMYDKGLILYISDVPLSLRKEGSIAEDVKLADKSMSTNSIYFNQNAVIDNGTEEGEKLFANEAVRQALSMVIDRQAIAEAVVYAEAATGLIPTGVFEAGNRKKTFRDQCTASYDTLAYNTAAAEQLLKDAGIKPSKYTFELTVAAYDDVHCAIGEIIVKSWQDLGFKVSLNKAQTIANNDYYKYTDSVPLDICDDLYAENFRAGHFEAILFDYVAYSTDPFGMLAPFAKPFSGRGMDMSTPGVYELPTHVTGYWNEEYDALIEKIFAEKTIADRAADLRAAEAMLMEDMAIVPVVFNLSATVTSSKLTGEKVDYYNVLNFQKCKVSSYNSYLKTGKEYITANFADLKFTECNDCAYKDFEIFKTSNTVYSQFFLDEIGK